MAANYQLEIQGIEGESQVKGFEKKIELESWSWGASQLGTFHEGGGGTGSKANIHDLMVTKKMDISSTTIMLNCWNGMHIKKAVLTLLKSSGDSMIPYYVVTLTDVIISSVQCGGGGGVGITGEMPHESVGINFRQCQIEWKTQEAGGATGKGKQYAWDVPGNKKV